MKKSWKQSIKTVWSRWMAKINPESTIELIADIIQMIVMFAFAKYVVELEHDHAVLFAWFIFMADRIVERVQKK